MRKTVISYNNSDGQMLYALMTRSNGIRVWIEKLDGTRYGEDWSVYVPNTSLDSDEFCANTWGDHLGQMASAMLATGWFMKTGKEFRYPESHPMSDGDGEIWALTHLGIVWLSASELSKISV